jgi:hypothetical protein
MSIQSNVMLFPEMKEVYALRFDFHVKNTFFKNNFSIIAATFKNIQSLKLRFI